MKPRNLPIKRKPLKRSVFRTIYAKVTGQVKRPATTTADPADIEGDIPNMNVGRALIVIALLHVVGIGGIFAQKYFESNNPTQATSGNNTPNSGSTGPSQKPLAIAAAGSAVAERPNASTAIVNMTDLPQIQAGDKRYLVLHGETYLSISLKQGISEQSLRDANNNVTLCSGLVLRVPQNEIRVIEPEEMRELRGNQAAVPRALLVRPNHDLETAPRAIPVNETTSHEVSSYTVRKGDTFYSIARKYNISTQKLMSSNSIHNERSLNIGQVLKIPAQQ
jgi:LysM repeat protein